MIRRAALASLLLVACGDRRAAERTGALEPGTVARVGATSIAEATVARVARAEGVSPSVAADHVIRDTLLASEAEGRGLVTTSGVRLAWEAELARRLLRSFLATARRDPPTRDELDAASARRWLEVARPEGFRTVHAVAMFKPTDPPEKKAKARAVAEAIRRRVETAIREVGESEAPDVASGPRIGPDNDPDPLSSAFRKAALDVHEAGVEIHVEPLAPVAADGRLLEPGDGTLVEEFSRAAAKLGHRGALSPIVESPFGAHVILLLEKTPAFVLEGDALRARLREDIVNARARAMQKKVFADRRGDVDVAGDATGLLALPRVDE